MGAREAGLLVITGATGLLGTAFVRQARRHGHDIRALSHRTTRSTSGVTPIQVDLIDPQATRLVIAEARPDWIVHCAALTNVDWCEDHPDDARLVNATATAALAEIAHDVGARLVYISTDSVFDGRRGDYGEDDAPGPLNAYARTKLDGENAVRRTLGERSLVIRTTMYGWTPHERKSIAEWFLDRLNANEPTPGFSDVRFDPMLADDLSDVVLDLMARHSGGLYHVAGSEACSKYEFGVRVARAFGLDERLIRSVKLADVALRAARPHDTTLRTNKASSALGRRMPDIDAGLERFRRLRDGEGARSSEATGRSVDAHV